jgi:hypothetical protein
MQNMENSLNTSEISSKYNSVLFHNMETFSRMYVYYLLKYSGDITFQMINEVDMQFFE